MNTNLCMYSEIMHFIYIYIIIYIIQLYYVLYFKITKKSYDRYLMIDSKNKKFYYYVNV